MKTTFLSFLSFVSLLLLLIVSCAKETSFEHQASGGAPAVYSFDGGSGTCIGATVSGIYKMGSPVTAANTVKIGVQVDTIGAYTISTVVVNGISFSGSGVFTSKGVQEVTLTASGTPATAGVFSFSPEGSTCTFAVTVADNAGSGGGAAVYSLNGGTSACTGAVLNGVFTAGTATTSANFVTLNLQVTTAGTYSIATNTSDGIQFSATGSFTATGAQKVVLTASGIPAAAGTFSFTPGANGCTFNVTVVAAAGSGTNPGSGTTSGNFLRCKINGVLTNFANNLAGLNVTPPGAGIPYSISVHGTNSNVAGSKEELWVNVSNATAPTTGVYDNLTLFASTTARGCQVGLYPNGFPNLYWGSSAIDTKTFSVNITSVTASGATGTFSGTLSENNGVGPATKNVTEGEFKITF